MSLLFVEQAFQSDRAEFSKGTVEVGRAARIREPLLSKDLEAVFQLAVGLGLWVGDCFAGHHNDPVNFPQ